MEKHFDIYKGDFHVYIILKFIEGKGYGVQFRCMEICYPYVWMENQSLADSYFLSSINYATQLVNNASSIDDVKSKFNHTWSETWQIPTNYLTIVAFIQKWQLSKNEKKLSLLDIEKMLA